jgi:hypothetical protein
MMRILLKKIEMMNLKMMKMLGLNYLRKTPQLRRLMKMPRKMLPMRRLTTLRWRRLVIQFV